jgi:5-methylcytosine-specific restriction endonuclease McrA
MRTCNVCQLEKEDNRFRLGIVKGRYYLRNECKDCESEKRRIRNLSDNKRKSINEFQRAYHEKNKLNPEYVTKKRKYAAISNERRRQSEKHRAWLIERKEVMMQRSFDLRLQKVIEQGPTEITIGNCVCCNSTTVVKSGSLIKCKKCVKGGVFKCYNKTKYNCSSCGVEYLSTKMNKGVCAICRDKQQKKSDSSKQARKAAKRARKRIVTQSVNVDLIYKRDGYKCVECKSKVVKSKTYKPNQATIDHIIPIAKGGSHTIDNLQTMCQSCNSKKRDIVKDGTQIGIFCAVSN